jgi:AcrR family transcriptional regulator
MLPPVTTSELASSAGSALSDSTLDVVRVIAERRAAKARPIEGMAQRLSASALTLFEARGYDAVTVAEIAAHAGVTSRTFFRYFPAKEMVLVDFNDQANERLVELIQTVRPGDAVFPVIRAALIAWFTELGPVLCAIGRLSTASPSLSSALLSRSTTWEEHLADALAARFDALDEEDSSVWAGILFTLLRLVSLRHGADEAEIVRGAVVITERFEALTSCSGATGR